MVEQNLDHPNFPSASNLQGISIGHLVAMASCAIITDPRSAKAYLERAAAMIGETAENAKVKGSAQKTRTLATWQMKRINEHIESNLGNPIRNRDLAVAARLSVSYLSRTFRLTTGQSPHAYVVDQRVRRARALMAQSRDPLSQIACACGFADQAHLSRIFKQRMGESPISWRRAREVRPASRSPSQDATYDATDPF
jgi:AraC family transcriptional regulator